MPKDYIEAEFAEISGQKEKDGGIMINAAPEAAFVSGIFTTINTISNNLKEERMYREEQKTERARIKSETKIAIETLKVQMEQIHAARDGYLRNLEIQHQENMQKLQDFSANYKIMLNMLHETVQAAVAAAQQTKDFSYVIELTNIESQSFTMYCEQVRQLPNLNSGGGMMLPGGDNSNQPKGCLQ